MGISAAASAEETSADEAELLVQAHCSGCHSLQLIGSQRGDEAFWIGLIRWMQETQNLWAIPPDQEQKIVSYLSLTYAEEASGRRPNLSQALVHEDHWPPTASANEE